MLVHGFWHFARYILKSADGGPKRCLYIVLSEELDGPPTLSLKVTVLFTAFSIDGLLSANHGSVVVVVDLIIGAVLDRAQGKRVAENVLYARVVAGRYAVAYHEILDVEGVLVVNGYLGCIRLSIGFLCERARLRFNRLCRSRICNLSQDIGPESGNEHSAWIDVLWIIVNRSTCYIASVTRVNY